MTLYIITAIMPIRESSSPLHDNPFHSLPPGPADAHIVANNRKPQPQVIRGNSVVMLEALERIGGDKN